LGNKSGQGHNLPGTRDSRHQDNLQVTRNLAASRSNTNKHGIGKINITHKNKLYNNDLRIATRSWDRELLRSELRSSGYDVIK
jgi:hypothetical protein